MRISDWSSDVCSSDLPKEKIRAVSFEADSDTSFAVPRAHGIERLRPQLEDIVAARPAVVVRSYGGDARLDGQLPAMGIRGVQLGFPMSFDDARRDMLRVGDKLGTETGRASLREGGCTSG